MRLGLGLGLSAFRTGEAEPPPETFYLFADDNPADLLVADDNPADYLIIG